MVVKRLLVPGQKYRLVLKFPYQRGDHEAVLVYLYDENDEFVFSVSAHGAPYSFPKEYMESWEHVPYDTISHLKRPVKRVKVKSA